jgi:hypothetical protein
MTPDEFEPPLDAARVSPISPPPELEGRIVDALRARGLLGTGGARRPAWRRYALAGLAAATLLVVGFVLGTRSRGTVGDDEAPRYLLLLYQDGTSAAFSAAARDSVVSEYRRWAGQLRSRGMLVMGEELSEAMATVPEDASPLHAPSDGRELGGFFVVRAADLAQAVELARGTPHARGGGVVVVRPINPT